MDKVKKIKEMIELLAGDLQKSMDNAQKELENMEASPFTMAQHQAVCLKYHEAQASKKAINQIYSYIERIIDKEQS